MGNLCVKLTNRIFDDIENITLDSQYVIPESSKISENEISPATEWGHTTPFIPPVEGGRVIKVYDGDTITIASKIPIPNSPLYRFQVRLSGIDTPEIKGKTKIEKEMARLARDSLSKIILGRWVTLRDVKLEKYGRILAYVECDGVCINSWMIKRRFAVIYDGGKKKTPKNWKRYYYQKCRS